MDASEDTDQAAVLNSLRGLIESVNAGGSGEQVEQQQNSGVITESMAQLIAAALTQVSQSLISSQNGHEQDIGESATTQQASSSSERHAIINPEETALPVADIGADNVEATVEITSSSRRKPICVKFPTEMRKKIIDMRKEGRKYKDIAKELGVSVSGVQKVWERFLATGMIHDRKPSTYAGRPRKFSAYKGEEVTGVVHTVTNTMCTQLL